ncbi:MAG: tetratricopeptide repeat protein, partial [Rickettsia endosymbiont of Labidopullus appendiculatus]|nr:tetratricopeptide repeat protein [Rickettsia endosymbiont of Labidopullus appendiculatus]
SLEMRKLIYKDEPHLSVAGSLHNLGLVYYSKGQHDKAIEYYTQSLEIKKLIYKDQPHPSIADSLNDLGVIYKDKGQDDKAIEYYTQSLEMRKLIYKDQPHPSVAASLNNLGVTYKDKGQHDKAIEYYTESLEMRKLIYKDEPHLSVAGSLHNLGLVYYSKGQYDKAIEYYTQSLEMRKLIYKDQPHPDVAVSLNNLGAVYRAKGEYKQGIDYGSQALQMISVFQDHHYQETIQNYLIESTKLFAERYCLNPPKLKNKILDFCKQGLDFTDYETHFALALSQDNNASEQQVEEMIEEYKLALIFLPKEELAIKLAIYNKLTELTGVNQKSIELWLAVAEGDTDKIKELITAEVGLDSVPFITTTPLIQAVIKGDVAMVRLISKKADINKPHSNQDQASPLYCSLGWFGQPINMKIVELLLASGADVNKPMYDGDTPMHMAHYRGNKEAIKLLLQYEAEINAKNDEGKTPLHCLLKKDFSVETKVGIIKEFHRMYDVTAQDKDGKTVIDYAKEHCPESLSLFSDNVEVVDPVDLSVTDFTINPDISSTNTSDNIDIDVILSGRLVD